MTIGAGHAMGGTGRARFCYDLHMGHLVGARWWLLPALGLALAAACGGKAVIDDQPSAAGGGSSSSSSSSSSGAGGRCAQACTLLAGCLDTPSCASRCASVGAQCKGPQGDFLQCLLDEHVDEFACNLPDVCFVKLYDFAACTGHAQTGGACDGPSDQGCSCTVSDEQGKSYSMSCTAEGGTQICACTDDGVTIGSCTQPGWNECDPYADCCGTLLFVPGP